MFTIKQIHSAHRKVKSGADFPAYIKEIKALGVTHYEAYVTDGHIDYHKGEEFTLTDQAKYEPVKIAEYTNKEGFKFELIDHQQGKTDYNTFIEMCGKMGIERWKVSLEKMTCIYYDKAGNEILTEKIPE